MSYIHLKYQFVRMFLDGVLSKQKHCCQTGSIQFVHIFIAVFLLLDLYLSNKTTFFFTVGLHVYLLSVPFPNGEIALCKKSLYPPGNHISCHF